MKRRGAKRGSKRRGKPRGIYVGTAEAAAVLGFSERIVRRWVRCGMLVGKLDGRRYWVLRAHLELLEQQHAS